jgi:hypothetical protein
MRHSKWILALLATLLALGTASLYGGATTARGQNGGGAICGVIETTRTITADAWLTCDVHCLQDAPVGSTLIGPCINFGRRNIKLSLNGFKMTGPANEPPRQGCISGASPDDFPTNEADGIHSKFDEVQIVGPGLVQGMRRHGIALFGTAADPVEKAQVKKVTSHQNCYSGIWLSRVNHTLVEEVVSVRNSANSGFRPCGGVCVTNSNFNTVRRSEFAGNGSVVPGPPPAAIPNDFGVGLVGSSGGNLIEENGMGGNINGLALFPLGPDIPTKNLIKRNVIAGNPPIEVSAGGAVGSDIRDFAGSAASNKFKENLCITYTFGGTNVQPVTPSPCAGSQHEPDRMFEPKLPQYAGHQNN